MTERVPPLPLRSHGALLVNCPRCHGELGDPVSGDVHCYVDCTRCGARFELDDPELVPPGSPTR